jgi:hypothetical protein
MADKLTPRARRLLVIAMVTPWLYLVVYYGSPLLNSQRRHLSSVEGHIGNIAPLWDKFRTEHPGFQEVHLFAYTGGDGMFGAWGYVASDAQVSELRKFMESTMPPRPIFLNSVHVVGPEYFEHARDANKHEPSSPAQGTR